MLLEPDENVPCISVADLSALTFAHQGRGLSKRMSRGEEDISRCDVAQEILVIG